MSTREVQGQSFLDAMPAKARDTEEMPSDREHKIPDDPWRHRNVRMRCRTCMFYVVKERAEGAKGTLTPYLGRCRRHAPTMSGYPVVFATDWCGDHKLDENK